MAEKRPGWYNVELPDGTGASGTSYANLFRNSGEYTYSEGNGSGEDGSICGPDRYSQCTEEEYWFEVPLVNWDTDEVEVTKGAKKYSSCNNEMLVTWFNNGGNTSYSNVINNVDIFEIKNIDDCSQIISTKDTTMYPFIAGTTSQNFQNFEKNYYVDSGFPLIVTDPYNYNNKCYISQNENYTPKYGGNTVGHKISYLPFSNTIPSQCITGNTNLVELYIPHIYRKYEDEKFNEVRRTRVISDGAFSGNTRLSAITLSAVEKIGNRAFYNCSGLTNIDWFHRCSDEEEINCRAGISGRTIGDEAFRNCKSIPMLDLMPFDGRPHSRDGSGNYGGLTLGKYSFADCTGVETLRIADCSEIPEGCFSNCTSLTDVYLSGGPYHTEAMRIIGDKAFSGCGSLSGINIPTGVVSVGDNAFDGCNFSHEVNGVIYAGTYEDEGYTHYACAIGVTDDFKNTGVKCDIRNGTRFICSNAFEGCASLTSVTLPDSIKEIRSEAFKDCASLASINIPSGITHITTDAFIGCTSLPTSGGFTYAGDCFIVNSNGAALGNQGNFNNKVKFIGDYAFQGNTNITEVRFPSNILEVGKYAFADCTGLTYVGMENNRSCMLDTIDEYAFYNCTGITSIDMPYNVHTVKEYAFAECMSFSSVSFLYGSFIEDYAFSGCTNLSNVSINDYEYVSNKAFIGCNITDLTLSTDSSGLHPIGDSFKGITSISALTITGATHEISDNAFSGCTGLKNVTLGLNLEKVGNNVFKGCTNLPVSGDIRYADYCAVSTANSKTSYAIAEGTKFICNGAFSGRTNMTAVTIPDGIISIGENAFSGCTGLRTVSSDCIYVENGAFKNCTRLSGCTLSQVQDIGKEVFMGCSSLSSITLPDTIKDIHEYAFKKCTNLRTMTVNAYKDDVSHRSEIPILRYSALLDCPSDIDIYVPSGSTSDYKESYTWDEHSDNIKPIE